MTSGAEQPNGLSKGRDGVPSWDGTPSSFQAFVEAAELYEQSTPYHKRYLCGPKLQAELSGSARRHVVGQRADWLSHNGGVDTLLQHLRQCLGRPQLPELTELLTQYFKGSRRHQNESMGSYISRKCELYIRAQQAMRRVQPHHGKSGSAGGGAPMSWTAPWSGSGWTSRRSSMDSQASGPEEGPETASQAAAPTAAAAAADDSEAERPRWTWDREDQWRSWDWNWTTSWQGQSSWSYSTGGTYETRASSLLPELVPEFVQAWYLLQDAGLEQNEKNLVLTAIKGEMDLQKMAQELRTQFPEVELRRRDQQRRHHGYWGHTEADEETDDEETGGTDMVFSAEQELNEEGYALWSSAASEAEEALAALQGARRTLKEARARQHQVKMNRKYFRGGPGGSKPPAQHRDDSKIVCLRCGKQGHRIANCPQGADYKKEPDAQAPFVCYATAGVVTEEPHQALATESPTTQEAVMQGKCVLDSGATRSLGSAHAIEQVMRLSSDAVARIDTSDCPKFGFGNSSEETCVSTVHLKVKAQGQDGTLKIHALSGGAGPILFSIEALRKLKAVVDYDSDMVVFRALNPSRIIQLEQSTSGHQVFPLTDDFYKNSVQACQEVPSLMSYVQNAGCPAEDQE